MRRGIPTRGLRVRLARQAGRFRICSGGLRLIRPGRINTGRPGSHRAVQIPDPIGRTRIRSCRFRLPGSLKARQPKSPAAMAGARNSAVLPASPNGPHQRRVWELSRELWRVWDDDAAALESEVEAAGAASCEADSMPDSIDWSGVDGAARDGFRGWPYRSSASHLHGPVRRRSESQRHRKDVDMRCQRSTLG